MILVSLPMFSWSRNLNTTYKILLDNHLTPSECNHGDSSEKASLRKLKIPEISHFNPDGNEISVIAFVHMVEES